MVVMRAVRVRKSRLSIGKMAIKRFGTKSAKNSRRRLAALPGRESKVTTI